MPQPKKTQNAVPPKVPRTPSAPLKAPIVRSPPTPPKLRREEAFIHEEASDTEGDTESDFEEEDGHDVGHDQHNKRHPLGQFYLQHQSCGPERGQRLHNAMDSHGSAGVDQRQSRPELCLGNKDLLNLLHARFERDHHRPDELRSTMDVEESVLHVPRRQPSQPKRK